MGDPWIQPETGAARDRLLLAVLHAVGRESYRRFTVHHVIDSAGASRGTFYRHFNDKADCFAQAHAAAVEVLSARIFQAAAPAPNWRLGVRAGLVELLSLVASYPAVARAVLIDSEAAGTQVQAQYAEMTARFGAALDAARGEALPHQPRRAGAFVVGGVREVIATRLRDRETKQFQDLLPGLVQFALLPYYGEQVAWEECKAVSLERRAARAD